MKTKILITGGAGFIGSEFARQAAARKNKLVVVDKLTYAGDRKRLRDVRKRVCFYKADVANFRRCEQIFKNEKPQTVVHFAAETHVDRSLNDGLPFIRTNVLGTHNIIELALKYKVKRFIHISTDEIYGESKSGRFKETAPINPTNPYSVTKASAELLVSAAIRAYKLPAIIVRPANNYGPWQTPEKFIPVLIRNAMANKKVPVYGRGKQIREWLYVGDCARAVHVILNKGKLGELYNIGSYYEHNNLTTAKFLLKELGKPQSLIKFVTDRPGHDFRYSVDCTKLRRLGWNPQVNFKQGMKITIAWFLRNKTWALKHKPYRNA